MDRSTPSLVILLKWGPSGGRYFWNERHKENEKHQLTTPKMTVNEKERGSNPTYDTTETIDYLAINIPRKIQEPHEENDEPVWRDKTNGEIHGVSEWEDFQQ